MYPYAAEDITTHDTGKPSVLAIYADSGITGAPPRMIGVARARMQDASWEIAVVGGGGGVGDVVGERGEIPLAAARICMRYASRAA